MTTEHSKYDLEAFEDEGIVWGAPISADNDGNPLPWLKDDDMVFCYWGDHTSGGPYHVDCVHGWGEGFQIRLPSTHWAYPVIAKGFTPWAGGDGAPGDAGEVMFRDGTINPESSMYRWGHARGGNKFAPECDIIGYRRKADAAKHTASTPVAAPASTPTEDIVRVLRVIEYVGPRSAVEEQIRNSLHGERQFRDIIIKVATVGTFPEILKGSE